MNWRFLRGIEAQFLALQKGFNEVIPQHLLKTFDEKELEVSAPVWCCTEALGAAGARLCPDSAAVLCPGIGTGQGLSSPGGTVAVCASHESCGNVPGAGSSQQLHKWLQPLSSSSNPSEPSEDLQQPRAVSVLQQSPGAESPEGSFLL